MKFLATIPVSLRARFAPDQPFVEQILFFERDIDIQDVGRDGMPLALMLADNPKKPVSYLRLDYPYHHHDGRIYCPSDSVQDLKDVLADPCSYNLPLRMSGSEKIDASSALIIRTGLVSPKLRKRIAELARTNGKLTDSKYAVALRHSVNQSAIAELDHGEALRLHDAFDDYQRLFSHIRISGEKTYQQVPEPRLTVDFGTGDISLIWSTRRFERKAPPTEIDLPLSMLDTAFEIATPIRDAIGRATPDDTDYVITVREPGSFSQTFEAREIQGLLKVLASQFTVFQDDVWTLGAKASSWTPDEVIQVIEGVICRLEAEHTGSPVVAATEVWLRHYEARNRLSPEHVKLPSRQPPRL